MTSVTEKNGPRGAGAILYSSLATAGWRFPSITLVEADEKYLFDLEVRMKLRHDLSLKTLQQVVADFPASLILRRAGIIHVLLDTLSSAYSFADYEINPVTYHPISVLRILRSILQKLVQEFKGIQDGGNLCIFQRPPASDSSASDSNDTKILELQLMRYPGLMMNQDITEVEQNGLEPHLSLSGFAFALCAATLPLLQCKHFGIILETVRIFQDALPFIADIWQEEATMQSIHQKRYQHLLNRFDQIALIPSYGKPNVAQFWMILNEEPASIVKSVTELEDHSLSCVYCYLFTRILCSIPNSLLYSKPDQQVVLGLEFGKQLQSIMMKMVLMQSQYIALLESEVANKFPKLFTEILQLVDPVHMQQQSQALSISESIAFLEQLDESEDESSTKSEKRNNLKKHSVTQIEEILRHVSKIMPLLLHNMEADNNSHLLHILAELRGYVPVLLVTVFSEISALIPSRNGLMENASDHDSDHDSGSDYYSPEELERRNYKLLRHHVVSMLGAFYVAFQTMPKFKSQKEQLLRLLEEDVLLSTLLLHSSSTLLRLLISDIVICISENCKPQWSLLASIFNSVFIDLSPQEIERCNSFYSENYGWLQLLSWSVNHNSDLSTPTEFANNGTTGKIAQQMFSKVPYPGIDRILAHVTNSPLHENVFTQKKMKVLGLFHQQRPVREEALSQLKMNLWPLQSKQQTDNEGQISWGQICKDLFEAESSFLNLSTIIQTAAKNAGEITIPMSRKPLSIITGSPSKSTTSTFSHPDIQRLYTLSFSSDLDLSIQYSAIQQFVTVLLDDLTLLQTCPLEWTTEVIGTCLDTLSHLVFDSKTDHVCREKISKLSRLQTQYLSCILHVVYLFLTRHPQCVDLLFQEGQLGLAQDAHKQDYYDVNNKMQVNKLVDANILIRLLIDAVQFHVGDKVSTSPEGITASMIQEGKKWLKFAAFLCAELLFVTTCHIRYWTLLTEQDSASEIHDVMVVKYKTEDNLPSQKDLILQVPKFLLQGVVRLPIVAESFQKLVLQSGDNGADVLLRSLRSLSPASTIRASSPKSNSQNSGNCSISLEVFNISSAVNTEKNPLPDVSLLEDALSYAGASTANRRDAHGSMWSMAIATYCFDLLTAATCHQEVYQRTLLLRMLGAVMNASQLDASFIDLNIQWITSISHIVTNVPRTKKDYFLLYHVIWILNQHVQGLLQYFQRNAASQTVTLRSQFIQGRILHHIATMIDVILPTVSLLVIPAHSVYANQRHVRYQHLQQSGVAVQHQKLQDLLVGIQQEAMVFVSLAAQFTAIHAIDDSVELEETDLSLGNVLFETGLMHYFTYHLLYQESHSKPMEMTLHHHRALWGQAMVHLVRNHEGLLLLQALERQEHSLHATFSATSTLMENDEEEDRNILVWTLQRMIRQAKLIRVPDSFQQHAISLSTLQLLHTCLLSLNSQSGQYMYNSALHEFLQGEEFWLWLVRFLYDRRYEMKVIALWILEALALHWKSAFKATMDSIGTEDPTSSHEESVQQWPPLDAWYHMAVDSQESSYIRTLCLKLSLQYVLANARGQPEAFWTSKNISFPMVRFVDVIDQLLRLDFTCHVSLLALTTLISGVVQPILELSQAPATSSLCPLFQEFHMFFQAQKLYPKLLRLFTCASAMENNSVGGDSFQLQERLTLMMQVRFRGSEDIIDDILYPKTNSKSKALYSGHLNYYYAENRNHENLVWILNDSIGQLCLTLAISPTSASIFADMVQFGSLWQRTLAAASSLIGSCMVSGGGENDEEVVFGKISDESLLVRLQVLSTFQSLWINLLSSSSSSAEYTVHSCLAIFSQLLMLYHHYYRTLDPKISLGTRSHNVNVQKLFGQVITVAMHFVSLYLTQFTHDAIEVKSALQFFYQLLEFRLSLLLPASQQAGIPSYENELLIYQVDTTLAWLLECVPACRQLVRDYAAVDPFHMIKKWLEIHMLAVVNAADAVQSAATAASSSAVPSGSPLGKLRQSASSSVVSQRSTGSNSQQRYRTTATTSLSKIKPSVVPPSFMGENLESMNSSKRSITVDMTRNRAKANRFTSSVSSTASTLHMYHDANNRDYRDEEEDALHNNSHADSLDISQQISVASETDGANNENPITVPTSSTSSPRKLPLSSSTSKKSINSASPVNRSSSFASPVSTNKWRDRARSYAWSKSADKPTFSSPISVTGSTTPGSTTKSHLKSNHSASMPSLTQISQRRAVCAAAMIIKHFPSLLPTTSTIEQLQETSTTAGWEITRAFCRALSQLLKYAAQHSLLISGSNMDASDSYLWSVSTNLKRLFRQTMTSEFSVQTGSQIWAASLAESKGMHVSEGQVSVAIFTLLQTLLHGQTSSSGNRLRTFFFRYAEDKYLSSALQETHGAPTVPKTSTAMVSTQTGLLHYLISLATNVSMTMAGRHLALFTLHDVFASGVDLPQQQHSLHQECTLVSPIVRISLSHILVLQIQRLLHQFSASNSFSGKTHSNKEDGWLLYALIHGLLAFLGSTDASTGVSCFSQYVADTHPVHNSHHVTRLHQQQHSHGKLRSEILAQEQSIVPLPQLFFWVMDICQRHRRAKDSTTNSAAAAASGGEVAIALERLVLQGIGRLLTEGSGANGKILAGFVTEEWLTYLYSSAIEQGHNSHSNTKQVQALASTLLWCILSQSERAKALMKQLPVYQAHEQQRDLQQGRQRIMGLTSLTENEETDSNMIIAESWESKQSRSMQNVRDLLA